MDKPHKPLHIRMPLETLIQEQSTGIQLLWIEGVLPLPIGSRINLDGMQVPLDPERFPKGTADAVVVSVSMWGTPNTGARLVLEVTLT